LCRRVDFALDLFMTMTSKTRLLGADETVALGRIIQPPARRRCRSLV
jgi:hypothetical protein